EHTEAAKLDTLAAAKRLLQGFENRLDRLFGFSAADICRGHHGVYKIQLNHALLLLPRQMLEGARLVVKTGGVIYTERLLWRIVAPLCRGKFSKSKKLRLRFREEMDVRQARPLDPAHVAGAQNDRAVYGSPGARWSYQLWSFFLRLRHSRGGRVPNFHQRQQHHRRSQTFRSAVAGRI